MKSSESRNVGTQAPSEFIHGRLDLNIVGRGRRSMRASESRNVGTQASGEFIIIRCAHFVLLVGRRWQSRVRRFAHDGSADIPYCLSHSQDLLLTESE
jgi:hypothetical protein